MYRGELCWLSVLMLSADAAPLGSATHWALGEHREFALPFGSAGKVELQGLFQLRGAGAWLGLAQPWVLGVPPCWGHTESWFSAWSAQKHHSHPRRDFSEGFRVCPEVLRAVSWAPKAPELPKSPHINPVGSETAQPQLSLHSSAALDARAVLKELHLKSGDIPPPDHPLSCRIPMGTGSVHGQGPSTAAAKSPQPRLHVQPRKSVRH